MKYIPSEEPENINSHNEKSPIQNIIILIVGAIGAYLILILTLGFAGEIAGQFITPKWEKKIFSFMDLKTAEKEWPLGNQLIDEIFKYNPISSEFKPRIFLSCSSTVNAFAYPGRQILFHKGLVEKITTLNGLFFVIGHELGHVLNRDHMKSIGRSMAISLGLSLINLGGESNSLLRIQQTLIEKTFSQTQESKSDDLAIEFTIKKFGGLAGANEFFDSINSGGENKLSQFFSTHPLTQERIQKIKTHPSFNLKTTLVTKLEKSAIDCN